MIELQKDHICDRCLTIYKRGRRLGGDRCEAHIAPEAGDDGFVPAILIYCGGKIEVLKRIYGADGGGGALSLEDGTPVVVVREDPQMGATLVKIVGVPYLTLRVESHLIQESRS